MSKATRIEVIRRIISEALGVQVSEDTYDLFDLGLDSLLVCEIVSRIRNELGVDLSVRDLFVSPCVDGIVQAIEPKRANEL